MANRARRPSALALSAVIATVVSATPSAVFADEKARSGETALAPSLEFQLGVHNSANVRRSDDKTDGTDARALLAIVPGFDKFYGRVFGLGAEYMFVWAGASKGTSRRLIMSLHPRMRMSFPVHGKLTLDGVLGVGPAVWMAQDGLKTANGGDDRLGWSLRFAFGASWQFNDAVAAFGSLGYYTTTTYGDDLTAELAAIPLSVGLRSVF